MVKKIKIKKIYSIFYLKDRNYVVFRANYSKYDFLFYKHLEKDIKALLFGENLQNALSEVLENPELEYVEILLDKIVHGGVSYNEGDLVESDFTKSKANQIISKLKNKLGFDSIVIELF
ncbi:MAG: hypothetical protein ACFFB0_20590 [Promethearchaeota archaeon]